jgi:hypothetical protein
MPQVWWPKFKAEVEILEYGKKRHDTIRLQAPSLFRAEEFVCYRYESHPGIGLDFDFEIVDLKFVNP